MFRVLFVLFNYNFSKSISISVLKSRSEWNQKLQPNWSHPQLCNKRSSIMGWSIFRFAFGGKTPNPFDLTNKYKRTSIIGWSTSIIGGGQFSVLLSGGKTPNPFDLTQPKNVVFDDCVSRKFFDSISQIRDLYNRFVFIPLFIGVSISLTPKQKKFLASFFFFFALWWVFLTYL